MTTSHRIHSVVALLLAAAAGNACSDSSGPDTHPIVAKSIHKISGDDQSTPRGRELASPLRVLVTGTDERPMAGATVRWTIAGGEAKLSAEQTVTSATGEAEVRVTEVATIGPVRVDAAVSGVAPIAFGLTGLDPCLFLTSPRIGIGDSIEGVLTSLDCVSTDGYFSDVYTFVLETQRAVLLRLRSIAYEPVLELWPDAPWYVYTGTVVPSHDVGFRAILPAGSYGVAASTLHSGTGGSYGLQLLAPTVEPTPCEDVFVMTGVITDQSLTTGDCSNASDGRVDLFSIVLAPGEHIILTARSAAFAPRIEFVAFNSAVTQSDADATGTATIDFTASAFGLYRIRASNGDGTGLGNYTLSILHAGASGPNAERSVPNRDARWMTGGLPLSPRSSVPLRLP